MRTNSKFAERVAVAVALLVIAPASAQDRVRADARTKVSIASAGCTTPAAAQAGGTAARELVDLHDRWAKARIDGDAAFLETFYAREFRITNMLGQVIERDVDIGLFAARPRVLKPIYIVDDDVCISVFGDDAALVTGVEHLKGTYKGEYAEMALRFTNVLVRSDGRWQMVTHHSTPVRKSGKAPAREPAGGQSRSDGDTRRQVAEAEPTGGLAVSAAQLRSENEVRTAI